MCTPPCTPRQPQTQSPFHHLPALIRFPQHRQCSPSLEMTNDLVGAGLGRGCPGAQASVSRSCEFKAALSCPVALLPGASPPLLPDDNALSLPARQGTDGRLRGKGTVSPRHGNTGKRHRVMDVGRGPSSQPLGAPHARASFACRPLSSSQNSPVLPNATLRHTQGACQHAPRPKAKGYLQ